MNDNSLPRILMGRPAIRPDLGSIRKIHWLIGLSAALAVMLTISACGTPQAETKPAATSNDPSHVATPQPRSINLPSWVLDGSDKTQAAYTVATLHAADLAYIPCYCSCGQFGHESVVDCFISGTDSAGAPIYSDHAYY
jgi:hypothetical protein